MAWTHYRLKFRLISPLFVGFRRSGNLWETRRYVPGKVLWAALTARLTRDRGLGNRGEAYVTTGANVHGGFRFGYLWPSLDGAEPYLPWEHADFDYQLLHSFVSTSVDVARSAALEGSLHETEYIAPRTRTGDPVYLVGDLWVASASSITEHEWRSTLANLRLGGELKYGWGRVELTGCDPASEALGGFAVTYAGDQVRLSLGSGQRITQHAYATGTEAVPGLSGSIEPLVGRERTPTGYQLTQDVRIAYKPGCSVSATEGVTVAVGNHGVLEAHSPVADGA